MAEKAEVESGARRSVAHWPGRPGPRRAAPAAKGLRQSTGSIPAARTGSPTPLPRHLSCSSSVLFCSVPRLGGQPPCRCNATVAMGNIIRENSLVGVCECDADVAQQIHATRGFQSRRWVVDLSRRVGPSRAPPCPPTPPVDSTSPCAPVATPRGAIYRHGATAASHVPGPPPPAQRARERSSPPDYPSGPSRPRRWVMTVRERCTNFPCECPDPWSVFCVLCSHSLACRPGGACWMLSFTRLVGSRLLSLGAFFPSSAFLFVAPYCCSSPLALSAAWRCADVVVLCTSRLRQPRILNLAYTSSPACIPAL